MKQSLIDYLYTQSYEVDHRVQLYLDKIDRIDMSTYKPSKLVIPDFTNKTEQRKWEVEMIRKTRHGDGGICGTAFLYTYLWKILSKGGGVRIPEFRRGMIEYFNIMESCLYGESDYYPDRRGKGTILMGRRRWGKSAGVGCFMYNAAIHNPYSRIGFTSKDEETVKRFFSDTLKVGYDHLPSYIRATTAAGNSQMKMEFSKKEKDKDGNITKKGKNSIIFGRAPTEDAFEGSGILAFVIDEMGKYDAGQLMKIWSLTEPSLADDGGIKRKGVPILTGTAGDMDTNGDDAKNFWYKADDYDLVRYAALGWNGFEVDECGNENVIEALKYILDEREKRKRQSMKRYYDFVVQYPLEEEEFFIQVGESPFDVELINNRIAYLDKNPPKIKRGYFRKANGKVEFIPKEDGDVQILEDKKDGIVYAAGCDPTDGAKKENTGSDLSFFVGKGIDFESELSDRGAVMQYTAKPLDMNIAYEQCALACEYYGCTVLIEKNRARMIAYFEDRELSHLLANKPAKIGKLSRDRTIEKGIYMDESVQSHMIGEIDNDSRGYIETYNFVDLLGDMCNYNPENKKKKYDRVDAWGLTLLNLRTTAKRGVLKNKDDDNMFKGLGFSFEKGKLQRA